MKNEQEKKLREEAKKIFYDEINKYKSTEDAYVREKRCNSFIDGYLAARKKAFEEIRSLEKRIKELENGLL